MIGKIVLIFGIVLVGIGLLIIALEKIGWFGNLPGDVAYTKGNFSFYFPVSTCILISVVLSLILLIINKLR